MVWGRPRFTADIDVVVELPREKSQYLIKALKALGKAGYIDSDSVDRAISSGGEFNFIDGNTGVKIDFWVLKKNDAFDVSRLRRKIAKTILREKIYFTSPEDLILVKLKWYKASGSSRQIEDVQSIIKISKEKLDFVYLKKWADKLGLSAVLKSLL